MRNKFGFEKNDIIEYAGETFEILEINIFGDSGTVAEWHVGMRGYTNTNFQFSAYGEDAKLVLKAKEISNPIGVIKSLKTISNEDCELFKDCSYRLYEGEQGAKYIFDNNTKKIILNDFKIQENFISVEFV